MYLEDYHICDAYIFQKARIQGKYIYSAYGAYAMKGNFPHS